MHGSSLVERLSATAPSIHLLSLINPINEWTLQSQNGDVELAASPWVRFSSLGSLSIRYEEIP